MSIFRLTFLFLLLVHFRIEADEAPGTLDEVFVTDQTPVINDFPGNTSIDRITAEELRINISPTIGETLKNELGVSNQSYGPGVGTPMIRGQSGPRVRVLNNGIGSNDVSGLSPDHAVSLEPVLSDSIEILKGPATLLYGGSAIGGAVNILDNKIPEKISEKPQLAFEQRYYSVRNETLSAAKIDDHEGSIAYHLDGFYRNSTNQRIGGMAIDETKVAQTNPTENVVQNSYGTLPNTGTEAINGSAGLSWVGDKGFIGAGINSNNNSYGIVPDGTGSGNTRIHLNQKKYDYKSMFKLPFAVASTVKSKLGYTDYLHTELVDGIAGNQFKQATYEARLELENQFPDSWNGVSGVHLNSSDMTAIDLQSSSILIPHSVSQNMGVFMLENYQKGTFTYHAGWRVDINSIQADGWSTFNYTPLSGAISMDWAPTHNHNFGVGINSSERSPNVEELLMNGYHDSTRSFERGNASLKTERITALELSYAGKYQDVKTSIRLFNNWGNRYIYQTRQGWTATGIPILQTSQQNAVFQGYETKVSRIFDIQNENQIEITLLSDFTRGYFTNGFDVPRIPPLRYGIQFDYLLNRFSAFTRLMRSNQQTYSGTYETRTSGFFMWDAGINYRLSNVNQQPFEIYLKGVNLLNGNNRNAVSYLRNFAPDAGRGVEMGMHIEF